MMCRTEGSIGHNKQAQPLRQTQTHAVSPSLLPSSPPPFCHIHTDARTRHTCTRLGLTAHPSQALKCGSVALTFCEDTPVAQPTSPVGTTSLCLGVGRGEVPWKGRGILQSLKKRKKEGKQSKAEVLPQAGSCSGCAFAGQKLQNWEYCQVLYQRKQPAQQLEMGSCQLCVSLRRLPFSFSLPFSSRHPSISCSLALCVGRAHTGPSLDHSAPLMLSSGVDCSPRWRGNAVLARGWAALTRVSWHWTRACWVAGRAAAAGALGRHSQVVPG